MNAPAAAPSSVDGPSGGGRGPRLSGSARALALEIAAETRAEWGYATDVIARAFRAHRELGSGERRRISETVYALIRFDRLLGAIVEEMLAPLVRAGGDPSPMLRDELKLLALELRDGLPVDAVRADVSRLLPRTPVDIDAAASPEAGLSGATGLEREAIRLSVPTWLLQKVTAERGPEAAHRLLEAMNHRAPLAIRVNAARTTREALMATLGEERVTARPGRWSATALVLETRVNAFGLSAFRNGLFEVMDEGSQLVADVVAPPPGGRVLDACAGAGGKTLALGALLANKGRVLALDVDGRKLEELRRRARRAGLSNVTARPITDDGARLPDEARPGAWDRVLVDAPCSGLGTLRRNPEARWRLTPEVVGAFATRQVGLLATYAPLVAVGGRLIYATCTVMEEENQGVIRRFLAERDDFVVVPIKEIWGKARIAELAQSDDGFLRLSPAEHDTDGFFAAVLRRTR